MNSVGTKIDYENGTLFIYDDTTLEADCPVKVDERLEEIRIISMREDARSKLILKCFKETQPCIGPMTNDEMSYGRWDKSHGNRLKKITIKNVDVVCIPYNNQDFSIGSYGYEEVPEIVLDNASIECPEVHGTRYVVYNALPPEGSTKISERMKYLVAQNNDQLVAMMSPEQKAARDKVAEKYPEMAKLFDVRHTVKIMEHYLECKRWREDIDDSYWVTRNGNSTFWMTLRTCVILGMDLNEATGIEIHFEIAKAKFIMNEYFKIPYELLDKTDPAEIVADLIKYYKEHYEMKDSTYEFLYECIPTYYHEFKPRERTHKEEVEAFFESMHRGGYNWYQYITL